MSYLHRDKYNSKRLTDNYATPKVTTKTKEEPKNFSSLAEIKRLSMQARKDKDPDEATTLENTEKNRMLFKNGIEEEEEDEKINKKEKEEKLKKYQRVENNKIEKKEEKGIKKIEVKHRKSLKKSSLSSSNNIKKKRVHFAESDNKTTDNINIKKKIENDSKIKTDRPENNYFKEIKDVKEFNINDEIKVNPKNNK